MTDESYDYIIVGAGTAGCLLANRLSADPRNRVLLLEAGGRDNWIWFHIPVGYLFAIGNPRADWMFTTQAEPGLNGRALAYPRGKVLGGSSAINAMIYMRGQARDYDGWRQMGLAGWGWDDVLPYFLKHEDHAAPPNAMHRSGGEWRVEHPRVRWEILDRIQDAAAALGIPRVDDFNTGNNAGTSYFQVNQKRGRRWSAARGFLEPARNRPNLRIETDSHADRIEFHEGRAVALRYRRGAEEMRAAARAEIILASGAIGSPALLERSGIGDGMRLAALGLPVVAHSPGVGENLQDHLQIRPIYKVTGIPTLNTRYRSLAWRAMMGAQYVLARRGPMTMAPSQLGAFVSSSSEYQTPNLEFHFQPLSLDKWGDGLHTFAAFTASVCNLRPTSRGSVHLADARRGGAIAISPRYLSTEADRRVAVDSLKWARRIVSQAPLAQYRPEEFRPGAKVQTDEDLLAAAGDLATTIFHPVGTARMGADGDVHAVLDERLRVRGVRGLRVVDASAMPAITSGNTNSPTLMIAEKGAEMILQVGR
jgi:choline dehydrogenase-like flavoprotein